MSDANFNIQSVHDKTIANINKILAGSALKVVKSAKQNLLANKHYVTGRLTKSVTASSAELKLEFGTNVPYANDIETGISSNNPSVNDISIWLKNKIRLGHITDKKILGFAKVIAQNITINKKIKNWNPFMLPSWEEMLKEVKPKLDQAVVQ